MERLIPVVRAGAQRVSDPQPMLLPHDAAAQGTARAPQCLFFELGEPSAPAGFGVFTGR